MAQAPQQATIWGDWIVAPPAPEPPVWLEELTDIQADLDAIERDDTEAMLNDWWWEQQMAAEYGIEDDYPDIIASMGGYA